MPAWWWKIFPQSGQFEYGEKSRLRREGARLTLKSPSPIVLEIALRVNLACKEMGIKTVAVHSGSGIAMHCTSAMPMTTFVGSGVSLPSATSGHLQYHRG